MLYVSMFRTKENLPYNARQLLLALGTSSSLFSSLVGGRLVVVVVVVVVVVAHWVSENAK